MEYLTIKEYADLMQITPQAVYKKIRAGRLETITRVVDGKNKMYIPAETPAADPGRPGSGPAAAAPVEDTSALERAIAALTAQLEEKDRQIAKLTELLGQAQQLQAHSQLLLEQPKSERAQDPALAAETPEQPKKRSFWDRLIGI